MPNQSGLKVGRLVLQHRLRSQRIRLTMDAEEVLLNKARNLGFKGYLLKESATVDLLQAIDCVPRGQWCITPALLGVSLREQRVGQELREKHHGLES